MTGSADPRARGPRARLADVGVGRRLAAAFGIVCLLTATMGAVAIWKLGAMDTAASEMGASATSMESASEAIFLADDIDGGTVEVLADYGAAAAARGPRAAALRRQADETLAQLLEE